MRSTEMNRIGRSVVVKLVVLLILLMIGIMMNAPTMHKNINYNLSSGHKVAMIYPRK